MEALAVISGASHHMRIGHHGFSRAGAGAVRSGVLAARCESAALGQVGRIGHQAGNGLKLGGTVTDVGQRVEQALGVGMLGVVEHITQSASLHDTAGVHNGDLITDVCHDTQVVGDHDHGHLALIAQLLHHAQDLSLNGNVQSGGGLVRNQNCGAAGQSDGDNHALLHAAGELMGILVCTSSGDTNHLQHLFSLLHGLSLGALLVQAIAGSDLLTHGEGGVQGGHGILEDHGDVGTAELLQLLVGHLVDILAADADGISGDNAGMGNQLQQMLSPALSGSFNYKGYVEASYLRGLGDDRFDVIDISTTQGFKYSSWLFMGAGAGVDIILPSLDYKHNVDPIVMIPLYADFRFLIGNQDKVGVNIDLRLGAAFNFSDDFPTNNGYIYEDDMSTPTTIAQGRYSLLRFNADTNADTITIGMKAENGSAEYVNPNAVKNITFEVYNISSRPAAVTFNGKKAKFNYDEATKTLSVKVKWGIAQEGAIVISK